MPANERDTVPAMVAQLVLTPENMQAIADDVARSLSFASTKGETAYVTTAVTYANGTAVMVRVDREKDGFFVTDDGYAALTADMFGGSHVFPKVAATVAKRFGVDYDHHSFFVLHVLRDQLPAAVALVANASAVAVERCIYALDNAKIKRSHVLFQERMTAAFGVNAVFDVNLRGNTRAWDVDAALIVNNEIRAVFEFVAPALQSVASAHLKIGDISASFTRPKTAIALADYDKTDAALREILSTSADVVIPASADVERYRLAA